MKKLITVLLFFLLSSELVRIQELNCQVSINTSQIQGTVNKQIFDQLQRAIFELMNNTKWTTEVFAPTEKIDCSIFISIKELFTKTFALINAKNVENILAQKRT